jgi:hypothetical protein
VLEMRKHRIQQFIISMVNAQLVLRVYIELALIGPLLERTEDFGSSACCIDIFGKIGSLRRSRQMCQATFAMQVPVASPGRRQARRCGRQAVTELD